MHQKLIHKIPRSNIVNPVTTVSEELNRTCKTPQPILNTTKYNKNLINLTGVFVLGASFAMIGLHVFGSRLSWINLRYGEESYLFTFSNLCFAPVVFPTMYLIFRPKCFISAIRCLKDM